MLNIIKRNIKIVENKVNEMKKDCLYIISEHKTESVYQRMQYNIFVVVDNLISNEFQNSVIVTNQ